MGDHPHARGLPGAGIQRGAHFGIIPARAGFTRTFASSLPRSRDHPRSRGVYFRTYIPLQHIRGSSPLARGLQEPVVLVRASAGIIPARAGFTNACTSGTHDLRDHPRSRGVYTLSSPLCIDLSGSSPLARGLQLPVTSAATSSRIIPARAGFTSRRGPCWSSPWDHPRSRGVYRAAIEPRL